MSDRHQQGPPREKLVWSVWEAAEVLGVSHAHLYQAIARREVPVIRLGRRILVPKEALRKWVVEEAKGA